MGGSREVARSFARGSARLVAWSVVWYSSSTSVHVYGARREAAGRAVNSSPLMITPAAQQRACRAGAGSRLCRPPNRRPESCCCCCFVNVTYDGFCVLCVSARVVTFLSCGHVPRVDADRMNHLRGSLLYVCVLVQQACTAVRV